jgi:hypothetical protein
MSRKPAYDFSVSKTREKHPGSQPPRLFSHGPTGGCPCTPPRAPAIGTPHPSHGRSMNLARRRSCTSSRRRLERERPSSQAIRRSRRRGMSCCPVSRRTPCGPNARGISPRRSLSLAHAVADARGWLDRLERWVGSTGNPGVEPVALVRVEDEVVAQREAWRPPHFAGLRPVAAVAPPGRRLGASRRRAWRARPSEWCRAAPAPG